MHSVVDRQLCGLETLASKKKKKACPNSSWWAMKDGSNSDMLSEKEASRKAAHLTSLCASPLFFPLHYVQSTEIDQKQIGGRYLVAKPCSRTLTGSENLDELDILCHAIESQPPQPLKFYA